MPTVGVSIASIPPRAPLLARALASVCAQTRPADQIVVHIDHEGVGAPDSKNAALAAIATDWVAFLDDDDEFLPQHLEHLLQTAEETGADLVYPWYQGINMGIFHIPDELGNLRIPLGIPFRQVHADMILAGNNFIPTTVLVRTQLAQEVGGFAVSGARGPHDNIEGDTGDDRALWQRLLNAGAKFVHHPEITWEWCGHDGVSGAHTSGMPWRRFPAYQQVAVG
jgi:glycosyltransferase involved in cell wall biosynthesis